ncbi:MAG: NADH-quinone oxidoreductase subunit NuoF [bacterium]
MNYPKLLLPNITGLDQLDVYLANNGFKAFEKALSLERSVLIDEVKKSGLKGRGGAGFPTGLKWSFMPKVKSKPHYLCVNGDESEPGSFKDRAIIERNPFMLIEGILIASFAMNITSAYIYIRGEYESAIQLLTKALETAYRSDYIGDGMRQKFNSDYSVDIYIVKGAGAYICGEETSQMNSIEGKRAYPRVKPPFPAASGLWNCPTTINNVETLTSVTAVLNIGSEEYSKIGAKTQPGTMLYGVSGNITKPGVYELPTGFNLKTLIYDICGGVPNDKKIKAVIPGGSSMPPLSPDEIDISLDEESLKPVGSHLGTGGVIVIDEDKDLVEITHRIAEFYHHESCGQCTPCREGTGWMVKVLKRMVHNNATHADIDLLIDIANNIEGNTICALGEAAAWPVRGFVTKFRKEFERAVKDERNYIAPNIAYGKRNTKDDLLFDN